jgi:hypothetical protein
MPESNEDLDSGCGDMRDHWVPSLSSRGTARKKIDSIGILLILVAEKKRILLASAAVGGILAPYFFLACSSQHVNSARFQF